MNIAYFLNWYNGCLQSNGSTPKSTSENGSTSNNGCLRRLSQSSEEKAGKEGEKYSAARFSDRLHNFLANLRAHTYDLFALITGGQARFQHLQSKEEGSTALSVQEKQQPAEPHSIASLQPKLLKQINSYHTKEVSDFALQFKGGNPSA